MKTTAQSLKEKKRVKGRGREKNTVAVVVMMMMLKKRIGGDCDDDGNGDDDDWMCDLPMRIDQRRGCC